MRSKVSLGSSREIAQGCGVSFVNCLYLIPLIIGQNFYTTYTTANQGPDTPAAQRNRAKRGYIVVISKDFIIRGCLGPRS